MTVKLKLVASLDIVNNLRARTGLVGLASVLICDTVLQWSGTL